MRVALGVGLHHPVLDAVVDHLRVVARRRPGRRGRSPSRRAPARRRRAATVATSLVGAADHQGVAVLEAPHAAAGAAVDEADALLGQRRGPADRVAEVGVAAVDDDVALGQEAGELVDRLLGGVAGRHHRPTPPAAGVAQRARPARRGRRRRVAFGVAGRSRPPRGRPGAGARPCCRPSARDRPCPASSGHLHAGRRARPGRPAGRGACRVQQVAVGLRLLERRER